MHTNSIVMTIDGGE